MKNKTLLMTIIPFFVVFISIGQSTSIFTDSRDGKKYKSVKIGKQTWMAENLAYKTKSGCWAYDSSQNNVKSYGYLYNWEAAKKACPSGWHLPSEQEYGKISYFYSGDAMKSSSGWWPEKCNGSNTSGFTGLPGGYRDDAGKFDLIGFYGFWWSSSLTDSGEPWHCSLVDRTGVVIKILPSKDYGFSVRCVKNY
jgi:uncharacterized protein (TIGR02145 family)